MDYVIGSVAALISGNVTPNRPKLIRRALTPTKHEPSPNVTPKSEFVEDRSIFLSPTQQKKKAIVKKSPKRIFQNPDLDTTEDCEGNSSVASPKAEKVKKHLKDDLETEEMSKKKSPGLKSPGNKLDTSDDVSPNKKAKIIDVPQLTNISTPKKKKKKRNSESNALETSNIDDEANEKKVAEEKEPLKNTEPDVKTKKNKKRRKSVAAVEDIEDDEPEKNNSPTKEKLSQTSETTVNKLENKEPNENQNKKKKNKKRNKKNKAAQSNTVTQKDNIEDKENKLNQNSIQTEKQKNKKKKNAKNKSKQIEEKIPSKVNEMEVEQDESESEAEDVKSKNLPNPNAITEKDSDSEHDSDNDIESENEESNKKILTNENQEQESSDEDEKPQRKNKKEIQNKDEKKEVISEDEIKRTLFVGNVPFSNKCKKEIKKMFNKYGQIETVRIRTIPVKDARVTPKLAIIKNELHPERSTVNVYVKFADISSVFKALIENNTVFNGNHLRVTRSGTTGAEHDPRLGVFVGNLPFALEDDTLRSKFEKCGEIQSVRIVRDKKTNAGKGFGYVNFASKDGVELALALSEEDLTIKNRILRVKRCTQGQGQGKTGENPRGKGQGKWNQRGETVQGKWNQRGENGQGEGAYRRVMNKRKQQEGGDGPPHKKQRNIQQPGADKKPRKEFVGMTAEKKKKQKFNKGQKKKKALSEILTKKP